MKKSTKTNAAQARTAAKVKQQRIDWKRVVTVGIDLGDRFSHFCALDADGAVVSEGRVATTPGAIELFFKTSRKRITIEAGTHSPWMSRLLARLGHEVIVANSRKLRLIYENQHKSDRVDAEYLARVARLDPKLLGAIEHRSEVGQCHLSLIRARDTLVRSRARLIQHVRSAIKSLGERIPAGTAEAFHKRAGASIPEGLREALMPLVAVIEQLTTRIKEYDRKVEQLAEDRYPDTAALTQVCGVGSLTALAYILTLEDEQRYRRSRSVGAWLGLVPGQHDSGESQQQRRITKEGDAYLRRLLVGCAQYILGPFASDSDLRRHGLLIAARGGSNAKKRAVVAVARKLAVLLHRCGEPAKSTNRSTTPANKPPQRNRWTNEESKHEGEKQQRRETNEHVDAQSDRLRPTYWRRASGRPTAGLQRSTGTDLSMHPARRADQECGWRRGPRRSSRFDRSPKQIRQNQRWAATSAVDRWGLLMER